MCEHVWQLQTLILPLSSFYHGSSLTFDPSRMRDLQGTLLMNSIFARMEFCVCVCVCMWKRALRDQSIKEDRFSRDRVVKENQYTSDIFYPPHTQTHKNTQMGWLHPHIPMQKPYNIQTTQLKGQMGVTHHLLYWKNSSESIKLSLSLSETQVIIFVWKIDSSRALVRAWLVVWLSGNERGFMLIPAGSESGHQGMSVCFLAFFL